MTLFRRGLRSKARDFNWHNVIGLRSWAPLVIVVASGVVISYPWASKLVYRAVGEAPPPARPPVAQGAPAGEGARAALDRATGGEVRWQPFSAGTPGRRLRSILRFAHTGEVLGVVGQTIAGIVSLGAVLLVYTGLALTLRRFVKWTRRRRRFGAGDATRAGARRAA